MGQLIGAHLDPVDERANPATSDLPADRPYRHNARAASFDAEMLV